MPSCARATAVAPRTWSPDRGRGGRSRTYYRFSCGVAHVDAACAGLRLERENARTWVANHVGLHDIQFESDVFNRAFDVHSPDRKFANDLIDARMIDWLLTVDVGFRFETAGPYVLCYGARRPPLELVPLIGTLKGFVDHVPRVVYELYGDADGIGEAEARAGRVEAAHGEASVTERTNP